MVSDRKRTLATVLVAALVVCAILGYLWDRNGGSLDFSDTEAMVVVSGSMDGEPRSEYDIESIPTGSLIFIRDVPSDPSGAAAFYSSLSVGDVLTFDYTHPVSHENMVVTHRIIGITESNGVYTYTLQGDSIADDPTNGSVQVVTSSSGDVIGKVVGVAPRLGQLTVFLSHWYGKLALILIPCAILIAVEVRSIVGNLRKARAEPEAAVPEPEARYDPMSDENLFRRL